MSRKPQQPSQPQSSNPEWFTVDRDGLREMYANFPNRRLVSELIQNAWDEDSKECHVHITPEGVETVVRVTDDNPEGFKDLRHAYTLFATTSKRSDPTKRGRFNIGEKLVIARANRATITTTTGAVIFDDKGRRQVDTRTGCGSEVLVRFPAWKTEDIAATLAYLTWLYPPKDIKYVVNDVQVPYVEPLAIRECILPTEFLREVDGQQMMVKTRRKTQIYFYPVRDRCDGAQLFEMGIPVCEIDGAYDVNVMQKVPLDKDRTMVPDTYLQDIYAETMMQFVDEIEPDDFSRASMRMALEDSRTDPETAAVLFHRSFGDNAVLQSHHYDSDQEAVRSGATLVPSRTFGAQVNAKIRTGGIQTSKEAFCRDMTVLAADGLPLPGGFRKIEETPARKNFAAYVQQLNADYYGGRVDVEFAHWTGSSTWALYERVGPGMGSAKITFNVFKMGNSVIQHPVTRGSAIVLHELAHARGNGHDGVFDQELTRTVNEHVSAIAREPERFRAFEPAAFPAAAAGK